MKVRVGKGREIEMDRERYREREIEREGRRNWVIPGYLKDKGRVGRRRLSGRRRDRERE